MTNEDLIKLILMYTVGGTAVGYALIYVFVWLPIRWLVDECFGDDGQNHEMGDEKWLNAFEAIGENFSRVFKKL